MTNHEKVEKTVDLIRTESIKANTTAISLGAVALAILDLADGARSIAAAIREGQKR